VRNQLIAQQVYSHLSEEAIDLIDKLIKPQGSRINLKQIFEHPWMRGNHNSINIEFRTADAEDDDMLDEESYCRCAATTAVECVCSILTPSQSSSLSPSTSTSSCYDSANDNQSPQWQQTTTPPFNKKS
jgi:hypothetical protein